LYYNFAAESFLSKKLCSRLHSIEVLFKKGKVRFQSHPLGDLEVTHALHLLARWVGKPVYEFLFVIIERFSLALTLETL